MAGLAGLTGAPWWTPLGSPLVSPGATHAVPATTATLIATANAARATAPAPDLRRCRSGIPAMAAPARCDLYSENLVLQNPVFEEHVFPPC